MSNKRTLPIAFDTPNLRILPKPPGDIPVISSYLGQELVFREDLLRRLAVLRSSEGNINLYKLSFQYNVLLSLFDIDEIEICIYNNRGEERVLKLISLEEKLSPREQEIINYIRGIIEHARTAIDFEEKYRAEFDVPSTRDEKKNLEKNLLKTLFSSRRSEDLNNEEWRIETVKDKFPEVNLIDENLFLYSSSVYVRSSDALDSDISLPIPISKEFSSIAMMSYVRNNDVSELDNFQAACLRALDEKRDPMQAFIKPNLIKSPVSNEQFTPVSDIDKSIISAFMNKANILVTNKTGGEYNLGISSSNLTLASAVSNLKKISFDISINSSESFKLENIRFKLIKNKLGEREVFKTFNINESYKKSRTYFNSQKSNNLGSAPVQYSYRSDENRRSVAISREQLHDNRLSSFNCNRVASKSSSLNSGYIQTNTSENPTTEILIDNSGTININRSVLLNRDSGEFLVNSSVIHKNHDTYNTVGIPKSEEKLKKITLTQFCISNHKDGTPVNVIKLSNVSPGIKISEVICTPEINGASFKIPFRPSNNEIIHGDPLPGVRYKYEISLIDTEGLHHMKLLSTKILTLPASPKNISLEDMGIVVDDSDNKLLKIALPKVGLSNYASAVSTTLDKIFSNSERSFYNEEFKGKLNENFRNIGKNFELHVNYVAIDDGEILETYFAGVSEEHSDDENFIFLIPSEIAMEDYIISYNLITTNPIDLVNLSEEIQDPDSKKFFKRSTSKFFSTMGKNAGVIPVTVKDPETGDEVYQSSTKYSQTSKLSRMVCAGGYTEINLSPGFRRHYLSRAKAFYNIDDGEFILKWKASRVSAGFRKETFLEFFIVTVVIEDVEIPLTAYPFLGFTYYKMRTPSMLGVASSVKFKIYPVYNDYSIDFKNVLETNFYSVKDIRVSGLKVL